MVGSDGDFLPHQNSTRQVLAAGNLYLSRYKTPGMPLNRHYVRLSSVVTITFQERIMYSVQQEAHAEHGESMRTNMQVTDMTVNSFSNQGDWSLAWYPFDSRQ